MSHPTQECNKDTASIKATIWQKKYNNMTDIERKQLEGFAAHVRRSSTDNIKSTLESIADHLGGLSEEMRKILFTELERRRNGEKTTESWLEDTFGGDDDI